MLNTGFKHTGALLNFVFLILLWVIFKYDTSNYFMYVFIVILFLLINLLNRRSDSDEKIKPHNKAVLITGCDTGFGHHLAKRLDSKGFSVFACCLFPEGSGANDLRKICSNRLKILPLDVTKDESVANALKFVKENLGSNELWAVVNNAGIVRGMNVELSTFQHFKDTIDVNTFGPIRVTKAFLSLLKKSKGRVVNIASAAARLAVPDSCPYVMSKRAIVAFSDCLSLEMIPWGVKVVSIEPEAFSTSIMSRGYQMQLIEDVLQDMDEDTKLAYGENYVKKLCKLSELSCYYTSNNIDIVLDDIEAAISEKNPRLVYRSSRNSFVLAVRYVIENLPTVFYRKLFMIGMKFVQHPFYDIKNN